MNKYKKDYQVYNKKEKRKKFLYYKQHYNLKRKIYFHNIQYYLHYQHIYLMIKMKLDRIYHNNYHIKNKTIQI